MLQAIVEIHRDSILHNVQAFQGLLKPKSQKLCAVVKSNAYGHGLDTVVPLFLDSGVHVFGVNNPEEAFQIRKIHRQIPILIMGDIPDLLKRVTYLNDPEFWILVSRLEQWELLSKLNPRPKIHIKVDTGMGRLGSSGEEFYQLLELGKKKHLPLDGIATHFASTEDFTEHSYTIKQLKLFQDAIDCAKSLGYNDLLRHCASSASTMLFEEARMDMVRIGISLYGLWPSLETKLSMILLKKTQIELKPVLTWKTKIRHIRKLPTGAFIGYGCTYRTTYPTKVAVIPVGYYEGLDRKLSNNGYFLVNGERARILGRVCMNMSMLDITHIPNVNIDDEVVMIGKSGDEVLPADQIATWTNTISYEVVTKILPQFPRVVVG